MRSGVAIIESYPCPHCHALLESHHRTWQGWLLCPECHRPGLPPERYVAPAEPRSAPAKPVSGDGDTAALMQELLKDRDARVMPHPLSSRRAPASSASRLIVSTGLIVSLFLLLVAYLDRSSQSSAIFGFLTILFFLLLLRLPKQR